METIKIIVSKQMAGYTFWTLPSTRKLVKSLVPNANPANIISVEYDINSEFEFSYGIYSALLGINNPSDLIGKVNEIQFIQYVAPSLTEKVLHSHPITA
jgi:hypothetical protein